MLPDTIYCTVSRWLLSERIIEAYLHNDMKQLLQIYLSDHKTTSFNQAINALTGLIAQPWSEMSEFGDQIEELQNLNRDYLS